MTAKNKAALKEKTDRSWQDNFKSSSLRVGFKIGLSRPMLEYLSAVADNVWWNWSVLGGASPDIDCFIAVSRALVLRGLIQLKPRAERDKKFDQMRRDGSNSYLYSNYKLTSAGEHVVALVKLAGVFVEQDLAATRHMRD